MHTDHAEHAPVNPYLLGGGLAVVTIITGLILPENLSMLLLGVLLFGIASVYFGFAVADGRPKSILLEVSIILLYLGVCAAGILVSGWWLVAGYLFHGFWDLLHHNRDFGAHIVGWYAPFCVLYDWAVAVFVAALLLT